MRQRDGFTMIELMFVVVIISILVSFAIPRFQAVADRARVATMRADLESLALHQEQYWTEYGRYTTLDDLVGYATSLDVEVSLDWFDTDGFAASATHAALPAWTCAYYVGDAPPDKTGPAEESERIVCEES